MRFFSFFPSMVVRWSKCKRDRRQCGNLRWRFTKLRQLFSRLCLLGVLLFFLIGLIDCLAGMLAVRRALFGLTGGFAITDFYVSCVSLSDIQFEPPRATSSSRGASLETIARLLGITSSPSTSLDMSLREDIEDVLRRYRVFGSLILFTVVSFGGFWSVLGSSAAIAFDGQDGVKRYINVKKWLSS